MNNNTGLALGIAGSFIVGFWGISIIRRSKKLKKIGVRVLGKITDIYPGRKDDRTGVTYFINMVSFKTESGELITGKTGYETDKYAYQINQPLPVIYDPSQPSNFIIDDNRSNFIGPLLLTMAIAGFVTCVVLFFILSNK